MPTHGTFDVETSLAKSIIFRKIGLANGAILKLWAAHPCPKFSREPPRAAMKAQASQSRFFFSLKSHVVRSESRRDYPAGIITVVIISIEQQSPKTGSLQAVILLCHKSHTVSQKKRLFFPILPDKHGVKYFAVLARPWRFCGILRLGDLRSKALAHPQIATTLCEYSIISVLSA